MEAIWRLLQNSPSKEEAAILIQRAYRNHREYELAWRLDVIQGRRPHKDTANMDLAMDLVTEFIEHEHWCEQRRILKNEQHWIVLGHDEC